MQANYLNGIVEEKLMLKYNTGNLKICLPVSFFLFYSFQPIQQTTKKVDLRGRGRQAKVIVSASSDGSWRWGAVRANIQPDGMR